MSPDSKTFDRVAAFFDLDGTLIPEPSLEQRFFFELRRSGAFPWINYLRWGVEALRLLPKGLLVVQHGNKRYLAGLHSDLVFRHLDSITFFEEGIARVAWHARQGHEIVLVSGTFEPFARLAATALECELEARGVQVGPRVCATRLAEERGEWTGYLAGEALYGPAKARAIQQLGKEEQVNLSGCHAYGNTLLDRQMLCAVGHAHAVNPGKGLTAIANEKDWPIWHWHLEKKLDSNVIEPLATEIQQVEERA
jgi:HAD superfamily hydrolase (TIGR01490 family)